jgi:hypothetical protein
LRIVARFLRRYLIVTGVLAALALGAPSIVILGLFALILPGLILAVMPTAFLYGAVFAIVWYPARHRIGQYRATVLSLAVVAGIGFGLPALMNVGASGAVAMLRAEDKEPPRPVAMSGTLRIERGPHASPVTQPPRGEARVYACDDLCAAGLFTHGVSAVRLASRPDGKPAPERRSRVELDAAYRLTSRSPDEASCPGAIVPVESRGGLDPWPDLKELRVAWKLALSGGTCLARLQGEAAPSAPDWILSFERDAPASGSGLWRLLPSARFTRVVIADGSGEVVRRTAVTVTVLQRWLWIEPRGGLENFRFGWSTRSFTDGAFEDIAFLSRMTNLGLSLERSSASPGTATDIRTALAAALDRANLPASDAAFTLVRSYLDGFSSFGRRPDVRPEDLPLLARLVADGRVRDFIGIYEAIKALGPDSAGLRGAMVARILSASYPQDREPTRYLGAALEALPSGLFAVPTGDEQRLLADPMRRRWATGLIVRQADRGGAAAHELARIIAEAHGRPAPARSHHEPDRLDDARAALRALCLLGPEARSVLPDLEALIESGTVPARTVEGEGWRFTLARLGKAIESFRKPDNLSGTEEALHGRLRSRLERFRPEYCR